MSDPLSAEPLTEEEEARYREGLRHAQPSWVETPTSLLDITRVEWMWRCKRLLTTLDAARAAITPEAGVRVVATKLDHFFEHEFITFQVGPDDPDSRLTPATYQRLEALADELGAALRVTPVEGEAGLRERIEALPRWFESYDLHGEGSCLRQHRTGEWIRDADLRAALSPEEPR